MGLSARQVGELVAELQPLVRGAEARGVQPLPPRDLLLALTPAADLPLTLYTGSLAIIGDQTSLGVPFQFRALSLARGDMLLTFTIFLAGFMVYEHVRRARPWTVPGSRRNRCAPKPASARRKAVGIEVAR